MTADDNDREAQKALMLRCEKLERDNARLRAAIAEVLEFRDGYPQMLLGNLPRIVLQEALEARP